MHKSPPCHFHNLLSCTTRTSNKTNDFQWTRRSSAAMGGCHQICRAWSRSGEKTSHFSFFALSWSMTIGHVIVMAVAFLEQNRSQHRTMVQNPDCSFVFLDYAKVQVSCQEQFCVKSEIFFQSNGEFTISCNRAHNLVSGCNYRTTKVDSRNNFL